MPKGSEELTNARKDEIISACAALYETMSFRDITLREIGARTSFTPHLDLQLLSDEGGDLPRPFPEGVRGLEPGPGADDGRA